MAAPVISIIPPSIGVVGLRLLGLIDIDSQWMKKSMYTEWYRHIKNEQVILRATT